MMLLAPWALWFLVIAGGVVALYLLKIKRRQAVVPALDFWLELAGRTKVHSLWERLKRILSMLLWVFVVLCLILALGNPILSLGRTKPRAIAVVIDNSASMQTVEGGVGAGAEGRTRLELAKKAIEELVTSRPVTDEWLLIESGKRARVLQPWTVDGKAIRRAGEKVEAYAGAGDLAEAVELAGQLLEGKPDPCIVVISDGGAGVLTSMGEKDARIVHWAIGETSDNVGIARLAVRAHQQQGVYHALLSVVNASDEKIETQVVLEIDGNPSSVELVSVEPKGTWEKSVVVEPTAGSGSDGARVLRASLERADSLMLDNEAFAVLAPIRPAVVWLVTKPEGAFFFEQALASMESLVWPEESLTIRPEQYDAAIGAIEGAGGNGERAIRRPDLIVFNGWTPPVLPKTGRFVVVNAVPKEVPGAVRGEIESPQMFLTPRMHAVTQHITLQGARVTKAMRVELSEPAVVLAHSADGDPLVMLFDQPDRQMLCIAFDVLDSDLPFRNAFPLLLRNAVAYMHHEAPSIIRSDYAIGESIRPLRAAPSGVTSAAVRVVRDEASKDIELPVRDGWFAFTETSRPGAVSVRLGEDVYYTAVNLNSADESRIAPAGTDEKVAEKLALSGRLFGALPWVGLVFIALGFIVLEWMTYHFRWTE